MSNFEEYWGNLDEKWDGKLDIKNFARKIWNDALAGKISYNESEQKGKKWKRTIWPIHVQYENDNLKKNAEQFNNLGEGIEMCFAQINDLKSRYNGLSNQIKKAVNSIDKAIENETIIIEQIANKFMKEE